MIASALTQLMQRLEKIDIPPQTRRILVWAGYPLFAFIIMMIAMYTALPRDRIKDKLESQMAMDPMSGQPLAMGLDATIGDLGLSLFTGPGVKLKDVVLRSRPINPNDKPARYIIDDLTLKIGLFGAIFNRPTYRFTGHLWSGEVNGRVSMKPDEMRVRVDVKDVVLTGVQGVQAALGGLPVEGTLKGKLDMVMPKGMLATGSGILEVALDGAILGDGKAKLTVPGDPFLAQGITFPRLKIGTLNGTITMEKGRGTLDNIRVHSADVDATLEGYVELRDPIGMSILHAYARLKPADALVKREPTLEIMMSALSGTAKRTDGFLGFQITGPLAQLFVKPDREPPPGVQTRALPSAAPSAPSAPVGAPPPPPGATVPSTPPPVVNPPPNEPAAAPPPPPPPTSATNTEPAPVVGPPVVNPPTSRENVGVPQGMRRALRGEEAIPPPPSTPPTPASNTGTPPPNEPQ